MANSLLFVLVIRRVNLLYITPRSFGHLVKMISELSKSSTIYKYLIFIYSEQMTHSENENDHFDLDHLDHILTMRPAEKLTG
jgi:hypothetical protein